MCMCLFTDCTEEIKSFHSETHGTLNVCTRKKCYLESAILTVLGKGLQVGNSISQGFFFLFVCFTENHWQIFTGKQENKPEFFLHSFNFLHFKAKLLTRTWKLSFLMKRWGYMRLGGNWWDKPSSRKLHSASLFFPITFVTFSIPCLDILSLSVQQSPGFWSRAECVGSWGINEAFRCLFWVLTVAPISGTEPSLQPLPGQAELSPTAGRPQGFWLCPAISCSVFGGSQGEPLKSNLKKSLGKNNTGDYLCQMWFTVKILLLVFINFADLWISAEIYILNFRLIECDLWDEWLIYFRGAVSQLCQCCDYKLLVSGIYNSPMKIVLIEAVFSQLLGCIWRPDKGRRRVALAWSWFCTWD